VVFGLGRAFMRAMSPAWQSSQRDAAPVNSARQSRQNFAGISRPPDRFTVAMTVIVDFSSN
jgi:hypothetical protein